MIEFACKPRPIGAERVDLGDERILPTIELTPPVRRSFERVKKPLAEKNLVKVTAIARVTGDDQR